jgi:hypothetical protein
MTVTALPPEVGDLDVDSPWTVPPRRTLHGRLGASVRHHPEIWLLTLASLTLYLFSAFWTTYSLHFWINDALNRSDDALYVTIGRDPHLGAIGFYWPPLPQLLQLPLMPFLRPFGAEIMAGPISSAVCLALTVPVMAKIGQRLRLSRPLTFTFCLVFALTPDMIYTASNGMSEACFLLTGAITMLGFLSYTESKATPDLLILSLGLSGAVMTRLEGPELTFAIALIAAFSLRHIRSSLWTTILIGLPPLGCFGLWMLVQWVLLKNPLFFLDQGQGGAGTGPGSRPWLPDIAADPAKVFPWAFGWVVVLAPVLILLLLVTVVTPRSRKTRGSLGILAAMGVFVAIQIFTVALQDGFGDPRYFVMAVLFGAVGAMWLASTRRDVLARAWNVGLIGLLVVAAGTGSYALTSGRITHLEDECVYFQYGVARVVPFLGRAQTGKYACVKPANGLLAWQQADTWIDSHLTDHDRILADNASNYAAELYTTRPKLFVVRNDRDWAKTVANPVDITYVITQSTSLSAPPNVAATYSQDEGATLVGLDRSEWHLVRSFGGALNVVHADTYVQIWHFVPSPGQPRTPVGTEQGVS